MQNSSPTFIPFPARVVAILQLCIAFTMLLGIMGYPFMGELFETRSSQLLFETVMGTTEKSEHPQVNAALFSQLPEEQKAYVLEHYAFLQAKNQSSFFAKLIHSIHILFIEISPWKQAWLLLSIVLSILLLLRIEGAAQAIWLLPLLTLVYTVDNRMYGTHTGMTREAKLFPSEQVIIEEYLKEPLSSHIAEQKDQLRKGWHNYLAQEWSAAGATVEDKVVEGEFYFDLARLEAHIKDRTSEPSPFRKQESWVMLGLYLSWNLFLANLVRKKMKEQAA